MSESMAVAEQIPTAEAAVQQPNSALVRPRSFAHSSIRTCEETAQL